MGTQSTSVEQVAVAERGEECSYLVGAIGFHHFVLSS
jgi:hypothetical protein